MSNRRLIGQFTTGIALALTSVLMAGCDRTPHRQPTAAQDLPTAEVRLQTVESKPRAATEEVVGTVRARVRATVAPKWSGRIEELPVALGQPVKTGQLIARVDAAETRARLAQAEATLAQAERDWRRAQTLLAEQASTKAEAEAAESRWQVAKAALAEAQAALSSAEIVAPFDGVVVRKLAEAGDLAQPGKPLIELENPKDLEVEAAIPETLIGRLGVGNTLSVRVGGAEHSCTVAEIAPAADTLSRTFVVRATLPNAASLRPGQFARVAIPLGDVSSIRVPATAVLQRGQLELVFLVETDRASLHLVKTGHRVGGEVEVLSGLNSGDRIVVQGQERLQDGQPVKVP